LRASNIIVHPGSKNAPHIPTGNKLHSPKGEMKKQERGGWEFKNRDITNGGVKQNHCFYLCNLKVKLISPQSLSV
jgi:hypothetical protein